PIFFNDDVAIGIADTEKYLKIQQGKELVLKIEEGQPVPSGGAVYNALKTGKTIIQEVPKAVYGIAFQSYAVPIKEDDQVIGVFVVGKSLKRKYEVLNTAETLSGSLTQISDAVNVISDSVQSLAKNNNNIFEASKIAAEKTKDTDQVISFVKEIASETNLLGLNAAIEAARVGENGRGFAIVAQEIRKLSTSTNESITKIDSVLSDVEHMVEKISNDLKDTNDIVQTQAASLEEMAASIEELSATAEILKDISSTL
ncbi:MAG TPA: methyl-accepting chemotaxis protein, partial [Lachnospiraceae bacterium]|nr:methyl-accepting chemotaxis protein [Lachnospiraceae bacterium]